MRDICWRNAAARAASVSCLIGHVDTVLQAEPFRREGAKAFGSGVSDMKGGNLVILAALRALHAAGALDGATITVMLTGDEEDPGAPNSVTRQPLVDAAARSDVALAFEGATPDLGVIGRRGVGTWHLKVTGRQAHSSGIFREETGYGAIFEVARILERFRVELPEPNLTYNPSIIVGGTDVTYDAAAKGGTAQGKTNVIPRAVEVEGDLRYITRAQFEAAAEKMRRIVTRTTCRRRARSSRCSSSTRRWPRPMRIAACCRRSTR